MNKSDFQQLIKGVSNQKIQVIPTAFNVVDYIPIDLSIHNDSLSSIDITSPVVMENFINEFISQNNAKVAFGGYLEQRNLYKRSTYFNSESNESAIREIHLGVDIWNAAGTEVLAVLDGEVHSFKNNLNHGDYGPCIVLKHQFNGFTFHTLYGHLSAASLDRLSIGQQILQDDVIATLGDSTVNGDYAPHLHFQIIIDMQNNFGDYPGVCSSNDLTFYQQNCPDPMWLLANLS